MQNTKRIFTTTLLAITAFFATAQVSIGFRGGLTQATVPQPSVISSFTPDFKYVTGASVAAIAEIGIHPNFAFQPELAFTQKGFAIREGFDVDIFNVPLPLGIKATTKVNYLEAPLLAKVKFGNEKVNAYIVAGPTFGYATGGRFTTKAQVLIDIKLIDRKLDLDRLGYERFEVGGTIGAGVSFNTNSNGSFFIDARYTKGFTNVYNIPVIDLQLKNQGFGLNVGYMIPLTSGKNRNVPRA